MWDMHGMGAGWWLVTVLGTLVFWALVVWVMITVVRGSRSATERTAPEPDAPLDILRRRLAKGEISLDEFERLRETLVEDRESAPA